VIERVNLVGVHLGQAVNLRIDCAARQQNGEQNP